jgi:SSS family transporter
LRLPLSALLVLAGYVAALTAFGAWLGRRRRTVHGYFLAERSVPWWAITACIVATETSVATFIGTPGQAYTGDWTFLQLVFGYVLGRILVTLVLIPAYFRGDLYTSYELLGQRFGSAVRATSSAIFLFTRTFADGIRLHAAALVVAVAAGGPHWEWVVILVLGAAMILYTEEGGVTATIWTDTIQMFVYLAGAVVCFVSVLGHLPGGLVPALDSASAAGKLRVMNLAFDLAQPFTLAAGIVGGAFLTVATHGTDHYLVQRLLVARSRKDASWALVLSGFVVLVQFAFFLLLGTLLWAHYQGRPFPRGDEVLPGYVSAHLPGPLVGFILAAVVAAALSPSLNSMASATVRDFYLPFVRPDADDATQLRVGRAFTVVWGLLQIGVALVAQHLTKSVLEAGLAALGYASGPTVGAFLLGLLSRTANSAGTLIGMVAGLAVSLAAGSLVGPYLFGWRGVAWTWNVVTAAGTTVLVGWVASRLIGGGDRGGRSVGQGPSPRTRLRISGAASPK